MHESGVLFCVGCERCGTKTTSNDALVNGRYAVGTGAKRILVDSVTFDEFCQGLDPATRDRANVTAQNFGVAAVVRVFDDDGCPKCKQGIVGTLRSRLVCLRAR